MQHHNHLWTTLNGVGITWGVLNVAQHGLSIFMGLGPLLIGIGACLQWGPKFIDWYESRQERKGDRR